MDVKKRDYSESDDVDLYGANSYDNGIGNDTFHKRIKVENRDGSIVASGTDFDEVLQPSAVVHCRGLPYNIGEAEITSLLAPFGRVESGQALIEMDSLQSSSAIIAQSSSPTPISLFGQKIFSPYGRVLRIVIFQKKGLQAFVEFESPYSAWVAKDALNGQDIYTGSCTLQIDFARVNKLNVKVNDEKTTDYTMDLIQPPGAPIGMTAHGYPFAPAHMDPTGFTKQSAYMMNPSAAAAAPHPSAVGVQPHHPGFMGYPMEPMTQSVIMVHKLPENITADQLFNIFCLYGTVLKIKMLHNTKSGAMVQMADGIQADSAIHCLNLANIFGQKIQVFHSRHPSIADSEKTKDYSESPLNRFKAGLGTYKNIYKPSATLHFLNVPMTFTEKDLTHLFINSGASAPNQVKFFPPQPSSTKLMGLVEFSDLKSATEALIIDFIC
ncbi:RNA-binding region RNP-1 domain-containing protein [Heterostelium album PN500]|uniref:RNA-binding region RNP-1 domain-containing protein n=1 Tax=Heterostelium pallidum (strain ATCC 26659 / Pp 5 / PN500) TaxID=670386 RepID=D3BH21_HETP5|nr:RNA-binding region RNP-1 domain-containing protein [Heterostelium album PN500]EFA79405.1 RNA-binding region RNP-1 domain-containing protein [Heterostelium album PN500]|eukprot:XP_020431526.1 RNA-binding region RNP-1 domain-containing protein [Heterostelium album PN500]